MKRIFFFSAIILLVVVLFILFWLNKSQLSWRNNKMETTKICFGQNCFIAEVAKTQAQRTRGLMFRESLASNEAMLFIFETPDTHSFWMKNCKIPLDIIWLDENYKVVAISPNNQPCPRGASPELAEGCPSINPGVLAKYVLEINAGLSAQLGLSENSYFTIDK